MFRSETVLHLIFFCIRLHSFLKPIIVKATKMIQIFLSLAILFFTRHAQTLQLNCA